MIIKKGLKVKILTGKDKNKEGEVIEIDRKNYRAKIKGINIVKKHVKTTKEKKGGIVSKENFIHLLKYLITKINCKILFNNSANELAYFIFKRLRFKPLYKETYKSYCFFMIKSDSNKVFTFRSYFNN